MATEIGKRKLAYLHLMSQSEFSRANLDIEESGFFKLMHVMKSQLSSTALILTEGMTYDQAVKMITLDEIDLTAFGENYISNLDLVSGMQDGLPLANSDRDTF